MTALCKQLLIKIFWAAVPILMISWKMRYKTLKRLKPVPRKSQDEPLVSHLSPRNLPNPRELPRKRLLLRHMGALHSHKMVDHQEVTVRARAKPRRFTLSSLQLEGEVLQLLQTWTLRWKWWQSTTCSQMGPQSRHWRTWTWLSFLATRRTAGTHKVLSWEAFLGCSIGWLAGYGTCSD